ncbi:MAG: 5'/3'-nucleotidase SurE [Gammaproteobacteria bacterium]|nr:5'/3'-nucleotidase SurE [Gammaproteobacteria bacterium]MCI0591035.1 5'/3'-nucleotidase SurE [Gammaproteobacteria bacterium]
MHFLLSNDDGYQAPGIQRLAEALTAIGEVSVVAPDRDRSGASNSLTLDAPIRAQRGDNGFIYVNGTPTDCVHLAITGLLEREPDMVIGGINAGANLGDDVLYSGTVAVAMEGRFLGYPAIAVSLASDQATHFESAICVVKSLIKGICSRPLPPDTILNVNVPDLPWKQLAGFQVTRLGHRHKSEPVVKGSDPRGQPIYWVGPPGAQQDAGVGTDFFAVQNHYVSVTPLQVDLTRYSALTTITEWLKDMPIDEQ